MIRGFVEAATPDLIQGWAFDDDDPAIRLTVRVRLGDAEVGQTTASAARPDLRERWNDNDGNHGFALEPPGLCGGARRRVVCEPAFQFCRAGPRGIRPGDLLPDPGGDAFERYKAV